MSTESKKDSGQLPPGDTVSLAQLLSYAENAIVSRILLKNDGGTVTIFAFDASQGLSEHTTPHDALLQLVEGQAEVTVGGTRATLVGGQAILLPAKVPHAVHATEQFKMLLVMLRSSPRNA